MFALVKGLSATSLVFYKSTFPRMYVIGIVLAY